MSNVIRQEIVFKAGADKVYKALTEDAQFGPATGGAPAQIAKEEGGKFSVFGGMISGRQVELIEDKRVVQAWRVKLWPEGQYSLVKFELSAHGDGTKVTLEHSS